MTSSFIPRAVFPTLESLPRSYYLGHHAAGLAKMRSMLSQIDLIIECRDYRVPITSHNPMFEESLAGKERLIVYTKRDLGSEGQHKSEDNKRENLLRKWHHPSPVLFSDARAKPDVQRILKEIKAANKARAALTGSFLLVVGMPNVGKSSLLNSLRYVGVGKGKVAKTGGQPGVTRKIAKSGVKIVDSAEEDSENVYLVDTPGVFMPYVPDADAMLKLALCGSVKDTIVPPYNLADYLLYYINQHNPEVYKDFCNPTNDVARLLEEIARKTGRFGKARSLDTEASALWLIQRWREGVFGRFVLDSIDEESLEKGRAGNQRTSISVSQARKTMKEAAAAKARQRKGSVT